MAWKFLKGKAQTLFSSPQVCSLAHGVSANACSPTRLPIGSTRQCPHHSLFANLTLAYRLPLLRPNQPTSNFEKLGAAPWLSLCTYGPTGSSPAVHVHPLPSTPLPSAKGTPQRGSSRPPWNFCGLFFCYWSLGSEFWKVRATTYFSVFICLMSGSPPPSANSRKAGTTRTPFTSVSPMPSTRPANTGAELSRITKILSREASKTNLNYSPFQSNKFSVPFNQNGSANRLFIKGHSTPGLEGVTPQSMDFRALKRNTVQFLSEQGVPTRELPRRGGGMWSEVGNWYLFLPGEIVQWSCSHTFAPFASCSAGNYCSSPNQGGLPRGPSAGPVCAGRRGNPRC